MSTPIILAIVLNMQTALQTISTAAGYVSDIKATSVVLDPTAIVATPTTEAPFLVVGHRIEPVSRRFTSRPVSLIEVRRIVVEAIVDAPGTDAARKITAMADLVADVEKALVVDITRGGLAMETKVEQETMYCGLANQNRCYVEMPVIVTYGRAYGHP